MTSFDWIAISSAGAAVASVIVAIAALRRSATANDTANKTQARLLEIEEQRERDRINQQARANLIGELVANDSGYPRHALRIRNTGRAAARDVSILLDGAPILQHQAAQRATQQGANAEITEIGPLSESSVILGLSRSCMPPYQLSITWTDDSGEPGQYQHTVTL